jgi:hypothetical protein
VRAIDAGPRTCEALSGILPQIGLRTRKTSGVSMVATGSEPSTGYAYLICTSQNSI